MQDTRYRFGLEMHLHNFSWKSVKSVVIKKMKKMEIEPEGFWEDMRRGGNNYSVFKILSPSSSEKVLPVLVAIVLIASLVLNCLPVCATGAGVTATVLNAAPTVDVELAPDDDSAPDVQVINQEPATNKTVTITANVCDLNGYDDIVNTSVTATITGPSMVEDSPVSLSFDTVVTVTTVAYTGSFNMSNHAEGDYKVEVTATDAGGLTGAGSKNFAYLYSTPVETVTVAPESAFDSRGRDVTTKVLGSDNRYAELKAKKGAEAYVEMNFVADIPDGSTIESVILYYEHHESSKLDNIFIDVYNDDTATWERYSGILREADTLDSQDVTAELNTVAEAGNNRIRYVCYESGGKDEKGYLGYAYLTITYSCIPDTTPPASITDLTNVSYAQTYINWMWTDPADADFSHVIVYIDGEFKENVPKGVQHYAATGFEPDTEHTIGTRTEDTKGNVNQMWVNHTARTAPIDSIPPASITDLTNVSYAPTYINWTWNDPADADFSHVMVYLNGSFKTTVSKGTQFYKATSLKPDTSYEIGTHTVDTSGNINETWVNRTAKTKAIGPSVTIWDAGKETVVDDENWQSVSFSASAAFTEIPEVVVTIAGTNKPADSKAISTRSRSTTGFEFFAPKASTEVTWIAYGNGSGSPIDTIDHGVTSVTANSWNTVAFGAVNFDSAPIVVITQETTSTDLRAASVKDITTSQFDVYSKYNCNIHWLAVGTGSAGSTDAVDSGVNSIGKRTWTQIDFATTFDSAPTVVTTQDESSSNKVRDLRDSPIDDIRTTDFDAYARSGACDLNWIAIGPSAAGAETVGTSTQNHGFYQTWIAPITQYISQFLGGGGVE